MLAQKYGTRVLLILIISSFIAFISLSGAYEFSGSGIWNQEYGIAVFEINKFDFGAFHFPKMHFEYSGFLAELYLFLLVGVMWLATVLITRKNIIHMWQNTRKKKSCFNF